MTRMKEKEEMNVVPYFYFFIIFIIFYYYYYYFFNYYIFIIFLLLLELFILGYICIFIYMCLYTLCVSRIR